MSNELCLIRQQLLTDIANAIRIKTGKSETMYPADMDTEILSIQTGITPDGSITISENGTHDVTNYASANVNIPTGITPTGSITISENGTYDVANYASAEVSIDTETYLPITVNITQSEHQTITATATATSSQLPVVNGQITVPTAITVHASIEATDEGYVPGTLNQTSVVANWGDTVSFSASPAIQYVPLSITVNVDPSSYTSEASELGSSYFTYNIAGVTFTLIPGQTVTEYVPPDTSYNVPLRSIDGYSWSQTRLQGNTGNGDSITLTLSKLSGILTIYTRYQSGDFADCQYTGTVAGRTVSGNTEGILRFTEYVGESYNITFTPPEGYTLNRPQSSGTFRTSMSPITIYLTEVITTE